ncbi:hypothetical protein ANCCAN_24394 [Ancylostoma caninum]|uniref:Uncharacterized protein n=1 Tax=Ancylostoma caninum TaxID=29170 RepID=A0A368FCE4_ANCCA|nr:hypothetical protein ANCCAN_24394 [Ancylostoma caninum]
MGVKRISPKVQDCIDVRFYRVSFRNFQDLDGEGLDITSDHQRNWKHVFVRCLQHMIGVIIFIRIQWITEQVGLGLTVGFILLAAIVSVLTTITIAAFCTEQRNGFFATIATYCSPGVSAGITVLYVISNVIAYACFSIGFAETLVNFLRNSGFHMIDASSNDMRIVSLLFCINVMAAAMLRSKENFRCRLGVLVLAVGRCPGLVPGWDKLTRGYGKEDNPRKAYVVISIAAVIMSMLADFNRVASILTIYYLSTYCLLNYIAFMASLKTDKPMFRFFKRWVALFTSFLCVHLILAVSWELTNAAILTFFKFYIFIKWKQSQLKGDQKIVGSSYNTALGGLKNMGRETEFGYKPQRKPLIMGLIAGL